LHDVITHDRSNGDHTNAIKPRRPLCRLWREALDIATATHGDEHLEHGIGARGLVVDGLELSPDVDAGKPVRHEAKLEDLGPRQIPEHLLDGLHQAERGRTGPSTS
jgi:hypothetical protein